MSATLTWGRASQRLRRADPLLIGLWLSLIAFAVIWVAPFIFILFTSLKTESEIANGSAFAPPLQPAWHNYTAAWQRGHFSTEVINSTVICLIKVPLGLFISAMAAYALSRMKIPAQRTIMLLVILGTMIPIQIVLAPLFGFISRLGLINHYAGLILPYIAFGVPYQVFVLYGFFRAMPRELGEAAVVDGAGHFTIFWRIFLPISLPPLAALFILDFVATWNEFGMALVLMQQSESWTLPLGLMAFQGQFSSAYGQLNAAIVMTVLPAAIVYMLFQRYFVSGLTMGAVKE